MKIIQLSIILICLCSCFDARGDNRVVKISADTAVASEQELFFIFDGLAMAHDRTTVDFTIRNVNLPFELYKVEFITGDSVLSTIEPFVFKVDELKLQVTQLNGGLRPSFRHFHTMTQLTGLS